MESAYLLLGSNLNDRLKNLQRAITGLKLCPSVAIKQSSRVYETDSWGREDLPPHLNQVVALTTNCSPEELLHYTQSIEIRLGRTRHEHWGARIIDIDILYFGNRIIHEPNLVVPHPLIQERRFALTPLTEIAPDFLHPVLKQTNRELLQQLKDPLRVKPFPTVL